MIKQETKIALREKPLEYRQALLRFVYTTMSADDFAGAFWDADAEVWTDEADEIAEAFEAEIAEPDANYLDASDATRLHEAICEGRRQDAIDILNEISDERFRSVCEQHNLFPDKVSA